jgi:hypothetical protein
MSFEAFTKEFGQPRAGSGAELAALGLEHSKPLQQFVAEVGGGVFADGLISVVSTREDVRDLGGWEAWLPPKARLFGCGAFGFLLATQGTDVWLVDTQYGQVIESDIPIEPLLLQMTESQSRDEDLREPLFKLWNRMMGPLDSKSVLSPTPAIPLAGQWSVETLSVMTLPVYLSFTGQMFAPGGGMPAEVRRL